METIPVTLQLDHLVLRKHKEEWGLPKPYLWNIFFKIDGEKVKITDTFHLKGKAAFHFSEGSHHNLPAFDFPVGEAIVIPTEVGTWKTQLAPFVLPYFEAPIPGVIGFIAILMDQKNLSAKGAEAGHQYLNEAVEQALNDALAEFDPKKVDIHDLERSIKNFFVKKLGQFSDTLEQGISKAVKESQNLLQNFWSLLDKDRLIGFHIWNISHLGIEEANGKVYFSHYWKGKGESEWGITGSLEVIDPIVAQQ